MRAQKRQRVKVDKYARKCPPRTKNARRKPPEGFVARTTTERCKHLISQGYRLTQPRMIVKAHTRKARRKRRARR